MLVRNSPCIIALYNGGSKAPIRLSGRGRSSLGIHFARPGMFRLFSLSTDIRLVPGNVVMVATDMCGKSPHHWERRVSSGGGVDTWNYGKHAFLTFF